MSRWRAAVAAGVFLFAAGGSVGYVLGMSRPDVAVLTSTASVGDREASIAVGAYTYGIEGAVAKWQDARGVWHDGGWPDCLDAIGSTRTIRFAETPVSVYGVTWREVLWVSCEAP